MSLSITLELTAYLSVKLGGSCEPMCSFPEIAQDTPVMFFSIVRGFVPS